MKIGTQNASTENGHRVAEVADSMARKRLAMVVTNMSLEDKVDTPQTLT